MAEKLPSGQYRARASYTDENGKRHKISFTRDTAREANYAALEFKLGKNRTVSHASMTVQEAVERYIDSSDAVLSPSTQMGYRKILRCYMGDIANVPLHRISNENAQRWINGLARKHSPKTISNSYGLLAAVLKTYEPSVSLRVQLPQKRKEEIQIPQPEDVARIIEAAQGSSMYLPVLLGAHCGLRRSEMSALTWADIDMKNKQLRIREALVRGDCGWERKAPKSTAGYRTLDMTQQIYDYLAAADKTKPPVSICPDTITKRFNALCRELDMNFNVHLLRHYFASVCAGIGLPMMYTIRLMGHASDGMVKQVYGHIFKQQEIEARQRVVDYLNGGR